MLPAPILPYIRMADFAVREPWQYGSRRLLDYLLVFVQEGRFVVTLADGEHVIAPGQFCLVQPNEMHALQGSTNTITPYMHFDVFYNPRREESFVTRPTHTDLSSLGHLLQPRLNKVPGINVPLAFSPPDAERFRSNMLKTIGIWKQRDSLSQIHAQYLATGLVLALLREFSQLSSQPIGYPQSLNWITSYLSFHLSETISVEDMARRAQLSTSHFTLHFRKTFGMSPHQYLIQLRVQHAQELLLNSPYTLFKIADACGFADIHHFSRVFKKVTGVSPRLYRENHRDATVE